MKNFNAKEYWEKRLEEDFTLCSVGYSSLGKSYNYWMYKIRRKVFLRKAASLPLDGEKCAVLDIGCGTGFYIERWKELNVRNITGIDITQVAIDNLQKRYPEYQFYRMDIGEDIDKSLENKFDIISAMDVLFHILEDEKFEKAIFNISKMLKPGGYFIWSDNFVHQKSVKIQHQVSRSLEYITRVLLSNNFEIIERRPMFYLMNTPIDTKSLLPKYIWKGWVKFISLNDVLGLIFGAVILPLELGFVRFKRESPSTELMICHKK